jgi:hypothetical protein
MEKNLTSLLLYDTRPSDLRIWPLPIAAWEQESVDFEKRCRVRSGIEGTISEADRMTGPKRV